MAAGGSSASIFRGSRGSMEIWGNSMVTAEKQPRRASRNIWAAKQQMTKTPRAQTPSGEPQRAPCRGSCAVPPLLSQEAAAARAAETPENMETDDVGALSHPIAPQAIIHKNSPSLSSAWSRLEKGRKSRCAKQGKEAPGSAHISCQPPARGSCCSHTLCFRGAARALILGGRRR